MIDWLGPIIWEQYGSTETGVVALCDSREWLAHPGSVGRPFLGSEIRIYGAQGVLPPGETGEVYARMHGTPDFTYLGQPSARADVERDGLVSAGDVGRLDADGYLYLVDRKSDMIISGGNNVYPAEVESQLARHHLVRDCAAFGVADAEYGERVVAAVSLTDGAGPDPSDDLRAFLRTTLADYKVPREFVVLDEVPRDDSGKLRRRQARELYQRHQAKS
jgi:long-chain acyl-CoA synthetase